jgi:excinuclease ABC subunit C
MLKITDIKHISNEPGIYKMMKDPDVILYVGKAKNLKKRLTSYFYKTNRNDKTTQLLKEATRIETTVVNNELESLLLEINLIKKHMPKYNVRLKNSNYYPYIRINPNGYYPKFEVSFKNEDPKYMYFGPYPEKNIAFHLVKKFNEAFLLRICSDNEFKLRSRPCIQHQIGLCSAPCVQKVSAEGYKQQIDYALDFLSHKDKIDIKIKELELDMIDQADQEKFEEATKTRNLIHNLKNILENQIITTSYNSDDIYYLDLSREGEFYYVGVFIKKDGKLTDLQTFTYEDLDHDSSNDELMENFITNFFINKENSIISTKYKIRKEILKELQLSFRLKNEDQDIIALINKNLSRKDRSLTAEELTKIKNDLNLSKIPYKIECYDISHFQGSSVVGAKSCFINGVRHPELYKRYNLPKSGNDDFKNLKEVIRQRLSNKVYDEFPDLIIIDGGKGQLSAVEEQLREMNISGIDLVSLAKDKVISNFSSEEIVSKKERIFFIDGTHKELEEGSVTFKICTQIRNEVHRTAIQYHRKIRNKKMFF